MKMPFSSRTSRKVFPPSKLTLKHSTVEAEGRVFIGRFKIEIVAKPQVEFVHEMTEWW